MAYATPAQLVERFDAEYELTQLTGAGSGSRDDERILLALEEASGQMDLYLGTRNALPLSGLGASQTAELERLCCDIARFRLWKDAASEEVRRRYDDAIRVLEQIAAGKVSLAPAGASGAVGAAEIATPTPSVFGRSGDGGLL